MLSLTDRLAIMRTALANERTLLAYGRTALALAAGGIAVAQLFPGPSVRAIGWTLVPTGALLLSLGWARFRRVRRRLLLLEAGASDRGDPPPA